MPRSRPADDLSSCPQARTAKPAHSHGRPKETRVNRALNPVPSRPETAPAAAREAAEGHGRRLTAAFEALEAFPALAESRNRVLRLVREEHSSAGDVVAAIESDVSLVIAVLRIANRAPAAKRGRIASVPDAIQLLTPSGVEALASRTAVFDFFERIPGWDAAPERFRLHAVATQRAADRLARETEFGERDELLVSSLLHDIGKLVLVHAYPGYPGQIHGTARTPEERLHRERRELGVDHALVGGVLARRWGLPSRLAAAIERHHSDEAHGEAAVIRLADMLAHYGHGKPIQPARMLKVARELGLDANKRRSVMYDLPYATGHQRPEIDPFRLTVH